jgi:hypothetical protein
MVTSFSQRMLVNGTCSYQKPCIARSGVYAALNEIVVTRNVTQSAVGDKEGLWTSVAAAAVFVG